MRLVFRVHAIQRMFQNGISEKDVRLDAETGDTFVITVYEPDLEIWEPDFRRKRS